jgi:putative SOS response-associated peptidase YedK
MCGRFHRFHSIQQIADQFRAKPAENLFVPPTYNAPPQTWQPVIRLDEEGEREIINMRWGLVPFFAKDDKIGYSTFNARAESILTSNAFRSAMKKRRCLVPVNGFYEWQKFEKGVKHPYAIGMKDGSAFAFAGLCEAWTETRDVISRRIAAAEERARIRAELNRNKLDIIVTDVTNDEGETMGTLALWDESRPDGKPDPPTPPDPDLDLTPRTLLTFTIITCDPNELVQEFHDRMPVIVDPKDYTRWLEQGDPQQPPIDHLRPYPAEKMRAWRIGSDVGDVRKNHPGLIDPIMGRDICRNENAPRSTIFLSETLPEIGQATYIEV